MCLLFISWYEANENVGNLGDVITYLLKHRTRSIKILNIALAVATMKSKRLIKKFLLKKSFWIFFFPILFLLIYPNGIYYCCCI